MNGTTKSGASDMSADMSAVETPGASNDVKSVGPERKATIVIDGCKIEAACPASILEAAGRAGISIPTLCHHPALEPYGSCRLCTVQIEKDGRKRFVTACNYPVEDGLVVNTCSPEVKAIRKMLIELLLAACPQEPRILDLASQFGIDRPRFAQETGECILCGLCHRVCEEMVGVSAINAQQRGVSRKVDTPYGELSEECIGCGACARVCPTSSISKRKNIYPLTAAEISDIEERRLAGKRDAALGVFSRLFSARSGIEGQDGGMVTAILCRALETGRIDAAIVAGRDTVLGAAGSVARDRSAVLDARGTKYVRISVLPALLKALGEGARKIAVVGTPCQIRVIRKLEKAGYFQENYPGTEIFAIGLFCFESFDYSALKEHAFRLWGIDLDSAKKMQIAKGRFRVRMGEKAGEKAREKANGIEYSCRVAELAPDVRAGCSFCDDLVSRLADISIGSIGSAQGYSTVVVRSERGNMLLEGVQYTAGEANRDEVARISAIKKGNADSSFARLIETSILDQYSS
ncbi:MAG TPA: Coenzyme F420 hydrogenase/dehydrogenase, beta subunit C-terminal domain [Methanothrix sp.]|nr:Coenzyme F420 hydrogenase/dehydrogenase, beta subunit C-terminal domain [Methanothrix sp.]